MMPRPQALDNIPVVELEFISNKKKAIKNFKSKAKNKRPSKLER